MHVVCDMDGTLFDTEFEVSIITASLATMAGFATEADEVFCHCAGMGAREKFAFLAAGAGKTVDAACLDDLAIRHEDMKSQIYLRDDIPLMMGLHSFLYRMQDAGARLSVGSSNPTDRQALGLIKTGSDAFFQDRLYGPDLVGGLKKPNPAVFFCAMAAAGIAPAQTVIIEDTEAGIIAGHAAGAKVIALLDPRFGTGHLAVAKAADFRACGADRVVRSLDDIGLPMLMGLGVVPEKRADYLPPAHTLN